ncbi:BLUF domain-containing protein [Gillisia sp. JM1]|uniref:BLUF domain-containing protein n=1 Tax=Gillisia sp. JM1 TaxID=1283286 RepID=UPI0003F5E04B|nr:BLUF domain-containing protein [Gillisia sp. JM1]
MHYAISYVSSANENLTETEIKKILDSSKKRNIDRGITGILLFLEGNFFQVLEGEMETLKALFQKIKYDFRHYNVMAIFEKEIDEANFEGYSADFITLNSQIQEEDFGRYLSQVETLNPSIQTSVKKIMNNFSEGIY